MDVFLHVQRIVRAVIQRALEVLHTHADYPFLRREKRRVNNGVSSCQARSRTSRGAA